jgi:anti-sigma factor ChrR (cupin superfamily)
MTDAERLTAIEDITRLMARRIRAMDSKDWALYDTCHAADATLDSFGTLPDRHKPAGSVARGKDEILAMIRKVVDGAVKLTTVHHAHMPEIEITSPTTAKGIWAMEDLLWWRNGDATEHLRGFGHYHETYEKIAGEWLIKSRVLTRLRVESTPDFQSYYDR